MTQIIKTNGISQKVMQSSIDCINRIAASYKTTVTKIEVLDKYNQEGITTWQIMYTFENGQWFTLMANRKAIY
jgi:hypothetical protein